jgi:uncharacterized protein (DUF1778 family)
MTTTSQKAKKIPVGKDPGTPKIAARKATKAKVPSVPASPRIELRAKREVKELIERAAAAVHKTVSAYLLDIAVVQAREDIRRAETLILDDAERAVFFSALSDPPKPNKALRELFQQNT